MEKKRRGKSLIQLTLWLLMAVFILSVIPLFAIMPYSRPIGDDLGFSKASHEAMIASGGFINVLRAAANTTKQVYLGWQGTISAVFLMALQPGIWNESYYGIGLALIMITFIFAVFSLIITIFKVFLPVHKQTALLLAIIITACCLQFVPFEMEGFFWFNGSIYYTFYFSIQCFLFSLILLNYSIKQRNPNSFIWHSMLIPFLCAIIGTGNYATALQTAVVLVACIIWSIFAKRFNLLVFISFLIFIAFFAISILAPGNAVRIAEESSHIGAGDPMRAIIYAVKNAFVYPQKWAKIPLLLSCAIALPFMINVVRKTKYSYRFPVVITAVSILYLAVGFVPTQYGQGLDGPLRLLDIQFHLFVFLLFFNLFYWCGWIYRLLETQFNQFVPQKNFEGFTSYLTSNLRRIAVIYFLVVAFLLLGACFIDKEVASLSASKSLITGEAQRYAQETDERTVVLKDESELNPKFLPLTALPHLLVQYDLSSDPGFWLNNSIAYYYNKESVRIVEKID